jgi:hypothetical protein
VRGAVMLDSDTLIASQGHADIRVDSHGSIILLHPATETAADWLRDHVAEDAQWWAGALVVEPRYVEDIVNGAREDGLEVR